MIATWMLYAIATSLLLGLAALAADRAGRLLRWPLRWTWVASLWGSVLVPVALPYAVRSTQERSLTETALREPPTQPSDPARATVPPAPARHPPFSLGALDRPLLVGWLLASLGVSATLLSGLLALARARRRWSTAVVGGARVRISPDVGPAVGLLGRDPIVLPAWALAAAPELQRLMVLHEREHVRARDPQLLLQAFLPLVLVPWNLPLWWQARRLRLAIEMDCDGRVLRQEADVARYGELLLEVGRRAIGRRTVPVAAFSEGRTSLEARIRMMTSTRPRYYLPLGMGLAAGAALPLAATGAVPHPAFRVPDLAAPRVVTRASENTGLQGTLGAMRTSLRNLVTAQEGYFAGHIAYASDLAKLAQYRSEPGVSVALLWAGTSGWVGKATAQGHRGSCVIYVGWIARRDEWPATELEQKTGEEGAPACDGDGQHAAKEWATYVRGMIASELRQVALNEEHHAGATRRYSTDLSNVWGTRFEGLKFEFLWADSSSFALKATLPAAFPGKSCVVWSGQPWREHKQPPATEAERRTAARGEAACDSL